MKPTRNSYSRRRRIQTEKEVEALGKPGRDESTIEINRTGARRKYVKVHPSFYPVLTHRQRVERNGYVKLSRSMGRLYTMARGEGTEMSMDEFVEQMSNEELVRGQVKAEDGSFRGRPPQWVPRAFHRACVTELMRRGKQLWTENYLEAIEAMTKIARGEVPGTRPRDQLAAAAYVIERLEGKVPDVVKVQTDQTWAVVLDGIIAEVSDEQVGRGQRALNAAHEARQDIVDAEIVDEEPEPVKATPRRRSAATKVTRRR